MSEKKCLRCGADEYRINGFCSVYCDAMYEAEQEIAALKLRIAELEGIVKKFSEAGSMQDLYDKILEMPEWIPAAVLPY